MRFLQIAAIVALIGPHYAWASGGAAHPTVPAEKQNMSETERVNPPLPKRSDVIGWPLLAKVTLKTANGQERPVFAPAITRLNKKVQRLQGYMVPLDSGEMQRHFLLSPERTSCPEEPERLIYVKPKAPIRFTMAPVVVAGVFNVGLNEETGFYYRVTDASESK